MAEEIRQTGGRRMGEAGARPPKFLDQLRGQLRVRRYSLRSEDAYVD